MPLAKWSKTCSPRCRCRSAAEVPRPTRKAFSLLLGSLVLFGVGANAQAGWLYVIAACLAGVVIAGVVMPKLAIKGIEVSRQVPMIATAGDPLYFEIVLANRSGASKGPLSGADLFLGGSVFAAPRIKAKSSLDVAVEVRAPRRGEYPGGEVELVSGAPFGIARVRKRVNVASGLLVHPRWIPLATFPLLEAASTPNEPIHERARRGAGMDFYGLRDYRSGDSLRHIHWRSTAKGGRLLTREYEEQLASRLTVLIDSSEDIGRESSTFEDSISAAAALTMYALDSGHPVQLFCESSGRTDHLFEPGKHEALDWMARLSAGGRRGMARLAAEATGEIFRRSTSVLVFPSTERNVEEARQAVGILQELSSRVICIVISAHTYDPRAVTALRAQSEEQLITGLAGSRAIVYKIDEKEDQSEWLRMPSML